MNTCLLNGLALKEHLGTFTYSNFTKVAGRRWGRCNQTKEVELFTFFFCKNKECKQKGATFTGSV